MTDATPDAPTGPLTDLDEPLTRRLAKSSTTPLAALDLHTVGYLLRHFRFLCHLVLPEV